MKRVIRGQWRSLVLPGAAVAACAALLILFASLSYSAARTKSATYDEPLHATAAYIHRTTGDFRINPEDPALFGYWGSIPHDRDALKLNLESHYWQAMLEDFSEKQWWFVWTTLYRTSGNDGDAFIQKSRFMFVIIGVAMGVAIACWSWQLGGAAAAVIATALLALDPNFSAHTALVKNDVMLAFFMTLLALALWRFGRCGTLLSLAGVVLVCAAAVNVKFSGLLCGPIIFLLLLARALFPQPWPLTGGFTLTQRWQRLITVPIACLAVAVACYSATWACYGFRFAPTSDPDALLNTQPLIIKARQNLAYLKNRPVDGIVTPEMVRAQPASTFVEAVVWAMEKRLLPQAWLHGLLYTYATTLVRSSYLLGNVGDVGWWYYFPLAMLFKTPTATLVASLIGALLVLGAAGGYAMGKYRRHLRRRRAALRAAHESAPPPPGPAGPWPWDRTWSVLCIVLPFSIYGLSAITTNLNLGLRHVLPMYPFLFMALGVLLAGFIRRHRAIGSGVAGLILLGLAIESIRAYPNYLAFFNAPSGGSRGGLELLGDSNLDWGQDLKLLAEWQKDHKDKRLYLAYFGTADPWFHGIDAIDLPAAMGGLPFAGSATLFDGGPCYLAVSATNLQCIYLPHPRVREYYRRLRQRPADFVLGGGTMYIYSNPPTDL